MSIQLSRRHDCTTFLIKFDTNMIGMSILVSRKHDFAVFFKIKIKNKQTKINALCLLLDVLDGDASGRRVHQHHCEHLETFIQTNEY